LGDGSFEDWYSSKVFGLFEAFQVKLKVDILFYVPLLITQSLAL
jgi:hypothetical protein